MTIGLRSFKLITMNDDFSEIELRRLDLNLLLVFAALMRERSVGRAARRLYLGASAVSMALARLRSALGDTLFVRAESAMAPTPRAQALWLEIAPALARIEGAVRATSFDPVSTDATFRFAAPDDLEFVLVPRLMERLGEAAPGATLVVRPADFHRLFGLLDDADADLALSALPKHGRERRHRVRMLHRDGFSVLYDRARLGCSGPIDLERFIETPHILLSIRGDRHGAVDDALSAQGLSRSIIGTVAHFPTMPFILRSRAVIACMPSIAAGFYAEAFDLECSPLPIPSPEFDVGLAWHVRTDGDPAQAWFRGLVEDVIAALPISAPTSRPGRHAGGRDRDP